MNRPWHGLTGLVLAMLVASCATGTPGRPAMGDARIVDGTSRAEVRYDASGTCSGGAVQLLAKQAVDELAQEWDTGPEDCDGPRKLALPEHADYPQRALRTRRSGSAHVLVRLEADGQVESVHAVCASDADFGAAAVETTRRIRFAPMTCEGRPTRVAFFLPLDYDI